MRKDIPPDQVELIYLREHREHAGWSVAELSRRSGVDSRTIRRIESGELCGLDTERSLAMAFGFDSMIAGGSTGLWDSQLCNHPESYDDEEHVRMMREGLEMGR